MFYHLNGLKSNGNSYLCTTSCYYSDTKINAGKSFQLLKKDEIVCLHAESTWLSEAVRHHLSVSVSFFDSLFSGGPVGRGHCPPSSPHSLPAWLILSCGSARKAVWITVSAPPPLIAIKDEGSFFSISPWLPSRHLPLKCRGMASLAPSHKLVIDGSFLSDSQYSVCTVFLYGGFCIMEFLLNEVQRHQGYVFVWITIILHKRTCSRQYYAISFHVCTKSTTSWQRSLSLQCPDVKKYSCNSRADTEDAIPVLVGLWTYWNLSPV